MGFYTGRRFTGFAVAFAILAVLFCAFGVFNAAYAEETSGILPDEGAKALCQDSDTGRESGALPEADGNPAATVNEGGESSSAAGSGVEGVTQFPVQLPASVGEPAEGNPGEGLADGSGAGEGPAAGSDADAGADADAGPAADGVQDASDVAAQADAASAQAPAALGTAGAAVPAAAAPSRATSPSVSYRSHVAGTGWKAYASNGGTSGGVAAGRDVEAVRVKVSGIDGGVSYAVYFKGTGWQKARTAAQTAGTTGKSTPIQAFRAKLTGAAARSYDLFYRVYVRGLGWLDWTSGWKAAGTTGYGRALQGLQMRLVRKSDPAPSSAGSAAPVAYVSAPKVSVSSHVQNIGWQKAVGNNKVSGTTGKGLQVEAMRTSVTKSGLTGGLSTKAHVQNIGWKSWVGNGKTAGTTGRSLQMEAAQMKLTGNLAKVYDLYYQAHVQNIGWMDWVKAGATAGTTGRGLQIEAVKVYVTLKGGKAPGKVVTPITGSYIYLDAGHGYSGSAGYDPGACANGYFEASETKNLVGKVASYAQSLYGLKVYNGTDSNLNFPDRQNDALKRGCTAYLSIHFNAGGGTGTETYSSSQYGASGSAKLQSIVHGNLVAATGLADRGQKDYGYSVLCGRVPAVLCEIAFIDNSSDMYLYKKREDQVARALAKSLYEASKAGF
ncbi:MAG: N-acetylmuramoyl-L-alanine amidase [Eggerthellaceae bacterium]